ncbi:MAG: HAD-IA family hydrolase [Oscillospiraceae bacterium]|nr:HAD-IA family hydrolase [Oscillospiraceae bacterium]
MSKNYSTVLFDLDGTLTDSSSGIFNCVKHALTSLGLEIPNDTTLNKFLGPPLIHSFKEFCGLDEDTAREAVRLYRQRYETVLTEENALYDGIEDMLKRLTDTGVTAAVATSKPEKYAVRILEGFGIRRYFKAVCGADPDDGKTEKAHLIKKALEQCGVTDLGTAVMVGDRSYDIEGAKSAGIASVGALYGYGSRAELEEAGADYIASKPNEIVKIILK